LLPFAAGTFDLVYCASLLEHLPDRTRLFEEAKRVLRPGGRALFSFPPFWSITLVGGHQHKPWHLLGVGEWERTGLYPLTTRRVEAELQNAGWQLVDKWARMWPANTLRLPWMLADWLTWHACYLVSVD
jgi:SAM-dependent methyltransferase